MRPLTNERLQRLTGAATGPCVSLYQPTHRSHPDAQQDLIRFRNLVREAVHSLRQAHTGREVAPLLEGFGRLMDDRDFWARRLDGLAVLASPGAFEVFELQRPVREL